MDNHKDGGKVTANDEAAAKKAAEAATKKAEKEAAAAQRKAEREAKKAEADAQKAQRKAELEAKRAAKAAEAEAKKAEREAKAKAKTEEAERKSKEREAKRMPEQNGVRRPGPDGLCGKVWALADAMSAEMAQPVPVASLLERGTAQGLNTANIRTEYARWKKFHGLSGRITTPAPAENAQAS